MTDVGTSRNKLLDAGKQILLDDGMGILTRGIRTSDVADRAGVSEKTFFVQFNSKEGFVRALIDSLGGDPENVARELKSLLGDALAGSNGDPRRAVRDVCIRSFELMRSHPTLVDQLALMVLARADRVAQLRLRKAYNIFDQAGIEAYEAILARWGVTLRKPFSIRQLSVAITAIEDGLSLRYLVDPEAVPSDLFGEIVLALIGSVADHAQSHEHIDDVLRPLADGVMASYQYSSIDGLPDDPRRAITDAAQAEFRARGYFATSLTHISGTARVPMPVLKRLFPSKAAIVVGALRGDVSDLEAQVADDIALCMASPKVVVRYLQRLAALADRRMEYIEALLGIVAHDMARSPEDAVQIREEVNLPAVLVPVIEDGLAQGAFRSDIPAADMAAMLVNSLLLRCFTRRSESAFEQARVVSEVFLLGVLSQ